MSFIKGSFWVNGIMKFLMQNSQKASLVQIIYQIIYFLEEKYFSFICIFFIDPKNKIPTDRVVNFFIKSIADCGFIELFCFVFCKKGITQNDYLFRRKKIIYNTVLLSK